MRYLVNISYSGLNYYGYQKQPDKKTIEGNIEESLSKILNRKIETTGCSRTDKGVHALDFYFHFDYEEDLNVQKLRKSLNSLTNEDIYIKSIKKVDDNFHARFDVLDKEYKYVINTGEYNPIRRNIELQYNKKINIDLIKETSNYLIGTHNFKSFTSDSEKENYIRTINYIKIVEENEIVTIYINANGFLKYMVRNIIGLFIEINEGKKELSEIPKILESLDRKSLGVRAKPEGLYLNKVNYKS